MDVRQNYSAIARNALRQCWLAALAQLLVACIPTVAVEPQDAGAHDAGRGTQTGAASGDTSTTPAHDAAAMGDAGSMRPPDAAGAGGTGATSSIDGGGKSGGSGGKSGGSGTDAGGGGSGGASVDRCTTGHGGCDPLVTCASSGGNMTCGACPSGYSDTNGDGTFCTDIDECATNHGGCDPLATCVNVIGSRTCGPCPMYYRGDGQTSCIHLWTQQLGTTAADYPYGIATDASGNVYVTGYTEGGLDGNINAGTTDLFVVKYNSTGQKQWTRQLGTTSGDAAYGVATDTSGNVYVAGATTGNLDGNTNAGAGDLFVVKYNGAGQKQWTRQLGTTAGDVARGVATDASDNVYVTGITYGNLDGNITAGNDDLFVVKYNGAGQKQWTRQFGTSANDEARGIATDGSSVYVTGYSGGGLDGNTNVGGDDLFIVKYSGAGQKQWTRQLGTMGGDLAYSVATDTSGNVYVAGGTTGGLDSNTNAGSVDDLFVIKYNSAGQKQWTRQLGTASFDNAYGVATDSSGNVYVTGYTGANLDGNAYAGIYDLFIVKYNGAGQKQWTRELGTAADDGATGIATDTNGNAYVTAYTQGSLDDNTNAGNYDLLVVKYDGDGNRL